MNERRYAKKRSEANLELDWMQGETRKSVRKREIKRQWKRAERQYSKLEIERQMEGLC